MLRLGALRGRLGGAGLAFLAALAVAIVANRALGQAGSTSGAGLDGIILMVLAVAVFVWALNRDRVGSREIAAPDPRDERDSHRGGFSLPGSRNRRAVAVLSSGVLALLAWMSFGGNQFTTTNLVLWLGSLAIFIGAFWDRPRLPFESWMETALNPASWSLRLSWRALALAAILLVGVFFRFFHLDVTPAEMTSDHAEKILDVWDVLNGQRPIFFLRNTGREAIQFYLAALTVHVMGIQLDHLALKIGTALVGVSAIPWAYLLGKQLFHRDIGLLAAALAAMSQWATAIDRVGLRFPFTAAFATPTLFFLIRAFQHNRRNDWILAGLFMGIGLHTYTPIRAVPVLLAALVGLKLIMDAAEALRGRPAGDGEHLARWDESSALNPRFWQNALLGLVTMLLVFLPLARFWQESPDIFWFRALTRAAERERDIAGSAGFVFADNVKNALLMFNYRGDQVPINTLPGAPVLDTITGALFVLGVAYLVWAFVVWRDRRTLYLGTMLFFLLFPSTSSIAFPNENPSAARTGGAIPVVMIVAAVALYLIVRQLSEAIADRSVNRGRAPSLVTTGLLAVTLGLAVQMNYDWYFVRYDAQWVNSAWNTREMGSLVRGFASTMGDMKHVFHVPFPHWADTRAIGINAGSPTWENALWINNPGGVQQLRQHAADPASKLYLVAQNDEESVRTLKQVHPDAIARVHRSPRPGKDFWTVVVPGRSPSG